MADIDWLLTAFCAKCNDGSHSNTLTSATVMYKDFSTKLDEWVYRGRLSADETQAIETNMKDLIAQFDSEATRGPYNNSYWVLQGNLESYTAYWEEFVNRKLEDRRQREERRREDEMYRDALQASRLAAAMETQMYAPGQLAQLEASRVDLPGDSEDDFPAEEASSSRSHSGGHHGSSSHSSRHRHHHGSSSQSVMTQLFGGRRRRR